MSRAAFTIALAAGLLGIAAPRPGKAQAPDVVTYQIQPGDTLNALGLALVRSRSDLREIARINRIRDVDLIYARGPLRIPRRVLRDVETPGKVTAFSGQVMVLAAGASRAIGLGDSIGEGATIVTGRNSFATLRLSDGSTVALPSQSAVQVIRLRRVILTGTIEREFKLENGRARAKVTPMPDANSTFRVRTPISHAAVRGTAFRSAYDAATGIALTEVDEGKVAVGADNGGKAPEVLLTPRYGAAFGTALAGVATALLDAPVLLDAGKPQTAAELHFSLAPQAGVQRYHIEIARDAGLLDPIAEETSVDPTFTLPSLPSGTYFARVAAVDVGGLEGASRTYAFERRRNSVAGTLTQSTSRGKKRYLFKWEVDADGEPTFRFQLRRISDNAPMVDELGLKERGLTIVDLPPGAYIWRVMSILPAEGNVLESWMPEQSFEVARRR